VDYGRISPNFMHYVPQYNNMGGGEQTKYLARIEVYNLIKSGELNLIAAIGEGAIPGLAKVLEGEGYWEKTLAISALKHIGGNKALRLLKKLLRNPEMGLQKEAINAVEGLDGRGIDSELKSIVESDPHYVASVALRVLKARKSRPPDEKGGFKIPKPKKGMPRADNFGNLKQAGKKVIAR